MPRTRRCSPLDYDAILEIAEPAEALKIIKEMAALRPFWVLQSFGNLAAGEAMAKDPENSVKKGTTVWLSEERDYVFAVEDWPRLVPLINLQLTFITQIVDGISRILVANHFGSGGVVKTSRRQQLQ
jgi:hypothetical protein